MSDPMRPNRDLDTTTGDEILGETGGSRPERSREAREAFEHQSDEAYESNTDTTARNVTNEDFGAGPGRPSGSGRSTVMTGDPGMADQPVEGGEDEVDQ